jgi:PadR family transcriptional regulator PadR
LSDKNNAVDNFQKGLNTGIAELILLSVVQKSKEHLYGYQIAKIIEKENGEVPVIKLGTLYPFLRSLEKSGFLESRLDHSSAGPPRRYYQITEKGKATLQELIVSWNRTKLFVNNILAGNQDER